MNDKAWDCSKYDTLLFGIQTFFVPILSAKSYRVLNQIVGIVVHEEIASFLGADGVEI